MSGDVFGNGMLLSPHDPAAGRLRPPPRLHRPRPRSGRPLAERQRLFALPAPSWDDYDRALISAGGGVWPRTAKSMPLTPEAREALGVEAETLAPTELIQAILRAPVDLLWNGGIGTYVKASHREQRRRRRPHQRRRPRRRARAAREGRRRGRQPRVHPARPDRVRAGRRPASTPTRSTTRPASTAPTTRSTSRSCSALAVARRRADARGARRAAPAASPTTSCTTCSTTTTCRCRSCPRRPPCPAGGWRPTRT